MNYSITGATDQAQVVDKLKSAGVHVIQSSNGLVCKATQSIEQLKKIIGADTCRVERLTDASNLSPDVQKFLAE